MGEKAKTDPAGAGEPKSGGVEAVGCGCFGPLGPPGGCRELPRRWTVSARGTRRFRLRTRKSRKAPNCPRFRCAIEGPSPDFGEPCQMSGCAAHYQRERRRRLRAARRQICASCGDVFMPARRDALFCSGACKTRDARRRKASGEPAGKRRQPQPPFLEPEPMPVVERPAERPGKRAKPFDPNALIG
jgi:hypothetical protein